MRIPRRGHQIWCPGVLLPVFGLNLVVGRGDFPYYSNQPENRDSVEISKKFSEGTQDFALFTSAEKYRLNPLPYRRF
jgi:hypothetical protein